MKLDSLEQQVLILHQAGYSIRAIAKHLDVDKSKVQRIISKMQKGTFDTVNDTILDSQGDTCDTGYVSPNDTPAERRLDTLYNTAPIDTIQQNNKINTADAPQGRFSLGRIGILTRQVSILKEDINDFILETSWLNEGGVSIIYWAYQIYLRRVQRLIQSTILLSDQLGVDYRNLLVTRVLQSIHAAIKEDFSEYPAPELPDDDDSVSIPQRDVKTWKALLKVDFLHPSNE